MEYKQVISQLTPEIYLSLKTALEIGKWPDGRVLSEAQKNSCMEAVLSYQSMKLDTKQHSGYMPDQCASKSSSVPAVTEEKIIKIH
ncbi:MAG: DUF1315 family protein [Oceanospirillaceae bacterium]|nr:DUF1315 family protein [Oceanospirillaceae bacterium]